MTPFEKSLFMRKKHGDSAITQAQQVLCCVEFTSKNSYWLKVIEILEE